MDVAKYDKNEGLIFLLLLLLLFLLILDYA